MATALNNKLLGQLGEHLVTAELARRGIIATPFSGNVPDIDILAHANGVTGHIQVKAIKSESWQFKITKFLDVEIQKSRQKVHGLQSYIDREILCVFVVVGEQLGADRFYIFKWGWLQDHFAKKFQPRKPPRNINSLHCALWEEEISEFRDNWELITSQFGLTADTEQSE